MDTKIAIGGGLFLLLMGFAYLSFNLDESVSTTNSSISVNFALPPNASVGFIILTDNLQSARLDDSDLSGYLSPIVVQPFEVSSIEYGQGDNLYPLDMNVYNLVKEQLGTGTQFYIIPGIENDGDTNIRHTLLITAQSTPTVYVIQNNTLRLVGE